VLDALKENEPFELSSEKENLKELFAQFNPIVNKILDQSENVIRTNLYDMEPITVGLTIELFLWAIVYMLVHHIYLKVVVKH
jgi:hypothetical protein